VKLVVATGNAGKLLEFQEILGELLAGGSHQLVSLQDLGLEVPDETGATFAENAALKARSAAVASRLWAIADDSGLCVDALDGGPGLHSARYADSDEARRARLLETLGGLPMSRRGAYFFCAVALSAPDDTRLFRAEGRVDGHIALAARGAQGFGYDPLFVPTEVPSRTLAELPAVEKNRLSHRGRALGRLAPLLIKLLAEGDLPG
jgi:XTP/dITP diphosphohydrolase